MCRWHLANIIAVGALIPRAKMRFNFRNTVSASAIAFGIALSSQAAQAADPVIEPSDNWYVSVFGGLSFAREHLSISDSHYDIHLKDGFSLGAAIGRQLGNGFRTDSELSYVQHKNKSFRFDDGASIPLSGRASAVFLLQNLWKDFQLSDSFQPYIGGGVGTAWLESDGNDGDQLWDDSSLGFALQFGAGARYALTDRIALDAGYRLKSVIDVGLAGDNNLSHSSASLYSHSAQLGLTYAFGGAGQVMPQGSGDPSDLYVSIFGGAALPDKSAFEYDGNIYSLSHKDGFTVGAAVGTHIAPGLRAEFEASYLRTGLKNASFDADSSGSASGHLNQGYFLSNIWKDFDLGMITPYIGGGLGFGTEKFSNASLDGNALSDKTGFGIAGQFGLGARVNISDNLSLDLGYRYKSIIDAMILAGDGVDFGENYDVATHNHLIQAGVTYGLGAGSGSSGDDLENPYVSLFGGAVGPRDTHFMHDRSSYLVDFNTGFTLGAAIGANVAPDLRGELELSYQGYSVDKVDNFGNVTGLEKRVDSYYAMANLWRDFDLGAFHPYAGGGVGLAVMDVDINLDSNQANKDATLALAAQVGSGVRFNLADNLVLDAGYRFKAALGVLTEGTGGGDHTTSSHYTHVGQVGVAWKF
jgi:opacity protein-like surface antigen